MSLVGEEINLTGGPYRKSTGYGQPAGPCFSCALETRESCKHSCDLLESHLDREEC